MKFKDIIGKKIAVHCKTEGEAALFMKMCANNGVLWISGEISDPFSTRWNELKSDTHYNCSEGRLSYCSPDFCKNKGYYIIDFSEIEDERKEKGMKTLEMLNAAQKTNNVYISEGGILYSNEKGFHESNGKEWKEKGLCPINTIFELANWRLFPKRKMTLEEIEQQLGCSIELISK